MHNFGLIFQFPGAAGGRARTRDEAAGEEGGREQGSGGRGNWRGGRILPAELLVTRDRDLKNKKGNFFIDKLSLCNT